MENKNLLPRERIFAGELANLSVEELLCVVLGRGTVQKNVFVLAKEIAGILEQKSRMPALEELLRIKGLGMAKSAQILACLELSGRFMLGLQDESIEKPTEIMSQLSFLKHSKQEHTVLVTLNGSNRVIKIHKITVGTLNFTPIHPRELFAPAIEDRAGAVIIAHNHPSGNHQPSLEDLLLTEKLCKAAEILQIPILDHLVISSSGYTSIRESHGEYFF